MKAEKEKNRPLTCSLTANRAELEAAMNHSPDLIGRAFAIGGRVDAVLLYMSGMLDVAVMQDAVLRPLISELYNPVLTAENGDAEIPLLEKADGDCRAETKDTDGQEKEKNGGKTGKGNADGAKTADADGQGKEKSGGGKEGIIDDLMRFSLPVAEMKVQDAVDELCDSLIYGDAVLLIEGEARALVLAFKKWDKRGIAEPPTSAILRGPREGFIEDMKTNTGLIRRRLRTPDLIYEEMKIGRYSNTAVTVAYIKGIADPAIVKKITDRLKKIDVDGIADSFYIQQFLEERKSSLFRQIGYTEKPDICAAKMLEGRIAIVVDGSPAVLTLPYILFEDIQSSGDYYNRSATGALIRVTRLIAILISVLLPGFYVAVQIYHYDILPPHMVVTLTNAVQKTPFSPLAEMIIVFTLFLIIYDASLRMPRYVGMALSIVGGLVLGDTAVKAGLISSSTVLISAISMLAAHTVPDEVSQTSFLVIVFILAGGLTGLLGILLGTIFLILYLASLDSYGAPYLAPYAPRIDEDIKDAMFPAHIGKRKTRPLSIPSVNRTRMGGSRGREKLEKRLSKK